MDALSQLVRIVRLEAALDLRCQFAEGVTVDHGPAPAHEIVFHVALSGNCLIDVEGMAPIEVRAGDFVAFPSGLAHRVRVGSQPDDSHRVATTSNGPLTLRRSELGEIELDLLCGRFSYDSSAVDRVFETLPTVLHVSLSEVTSDTDLRLLVSLIRTEVEGDMPGAVAIVASLCTALFTLAMRISSRRAGLSPCLLRLIGDARLARAVQAILQEPGRAWTLDQLAGLVAMSRATFARRFSEASAMTPGGLLLQTRMSRAAELLQRTKRGVADIGTEVGYQSEAAFSKAFRRAMAVSPATFRRNGVDSERRRDE